MKGVLVWLLHYINLLSVQILNFKKKKVCFLFEYSLKKNKSTLILLINNVFDKYKKIILEKNLKKIYTYFIKLFLTIKVLVEYNKKNNLIILSINIIYFNNF